MTYVMAYVAAVPNGKKADYTKHATLAAEVFRSHGATRIVECWGDQVPPGEMTSFPLAVKAEAGETVVMGWQEWPDKAAQDKGMPAAMQDPRMGGMSGMPFDGKRMIFAGFEVLLDV